MRIVLAGLRGAITVRDEPYNQSGALSMPAMAQALDDAKIAAILTYVRREFHTAAGPIDIDTVARIRAATAGRTEPWTEGELGEAE